MCSYEFSKVQSVTISWVYNSGYYLSLSCESYDIVYNGITKRVDKLKDSKTYKAKAWRMEKNKQFSKLYDQIEKAYKDGKITKIQYDKNMEKLLKDFSD